MTGKVVNLRTARKRAARAAQQQEAAQNAALHGRSKTERNVESARKAREIQTLDGKKRETPDSPITQNDPDQGPEPT